MKSSTLLVSSAIASVLLLGALGANTAFAAKERMEKCAGIAKAGQNDCASAMHSCAGQSKADAGKDEWVYVPTGSCAKIMGGTALKADKS